ncbi:VCP-like ATPase [Candidatus Phytoplasma pruni]|uniref:VCP-like ATPase n=1 Tax=Candidatus Phytoplasma pruni TaxID=479893 RepID=A0A0M1MZE2_9MOLU|nr:ATP-binding protein [Candidatus Phytoplasma pruni]KOR75271.1 VCP-like ATPase [Candidatus Phytoplasma pruni]
MVFLKQQNTTLQEKQKQETEQKTTQEEGDALAEQLKKLRQENQKKIDEADKLKRQDDVLKQKIDLNIKRHNEINNLLVAINQKKTNIEEALKKLPVTEVAQKETLQNELTSLKAEEAKLQQEKEGLIKESEDLVNQRKNLLQIQTVNKKEIEQQNILIDKKSKLAVFQEEINDLRDAMAYNDAEKEKITQFLQKANLPQEEEARLRNYRLFLDSQLLSFDKRLQKLLRDIENIQKNQLENMQKKPKTLDNVYGMEEEKEKFANILHYLKGEKHVLGYQNVKPMGILLYGPPGTGKSHLIEAICGETGTHYIELEPSRLDKTYVGEGNEELEKIWAEAEAHDKSIIFIDEISGLANREDKNTNQTASNIINNLLTKLDGFKKSEKKIILMGATNHLEKIDSALRSRFQQEIEINSFKKEEIPGFLKYLILANNYRISYHTFNHLTTLIDKIPPIEEIKENDSEQEKNRKIKENEKKTFSNRDWVKLLSDAFMTYDRLAFVNKNHEVMLPSDLDESLDNKLGIKKTKAEIEAHRKECEDQYGEWKKGLNIKSLDHTIVDQTYTFARFNGLDKCQYPDKVPTDLKAFVKQKPFNQWYNRDELPHIDRERQINSMYQVDFSSDVTRNNSLFTQKNTFADGFTINADNNIEIQYEGPKYILDTDKDWYITKIEIPKDNRLGTTDKQIYYLHFNPVKQYITLYTEPMNTK